MKLFSIKQILVFFELLTVLLTVTSCQMSNNSIGNETASLSIQTQVYIKITPSETPTVNQVPTGTHTWAPTITPTFTTPPTIVWTPLPTLAADKAEMQVLDLLNHNAGCRLPCWWGIIPGETSVTTTVQFLSTFTDVETVWGSPGDYHFLHVVPGSVVEDINSYYKIFGDYGSVDYTFRGGLVDTISAYHGGGTGDRRVETYQLSRLLVEYGKPDEIWFSASPGSPLGSIADLYIFYGQQGIFTHYIYYDLGTIGSKLQICPQGIGPEELELWSPAKQQFTTLEDYYFHHPISWPPLEKATGLNIDTFYQKFNNPSRSACFETPVELWEYVSPTTTP